MLIKGEIRIVQISIFRPKLEQRKWRILAEHLGLEATYAGRWLYIYDGDLLP